MIQLNSLSYGEEDAEVNYSIINLISQKKLLYY